MQMVPLWCCCYTLKTWPRRPTLAQYVTHDNSRHHMCQHARYAFWTAVHWLPVNSVGRRCQHGGGHFRSVDLRYICLIFWDVVNIWRCLFYWDLRSSQRCCTSDLVGLRTWIKKSTMASASPSQTTGLYSVELLVRMWVNNVAADINT